MKVRKAELRDLQCLVKFTANEALDAEGKEKSTANLEVGIRKALEDTSIALYWVLVDDNDRPCGSVSAVKEWSDWNAGYYWWIQSMYLAPETRGKGLMQKLLDAVNVEMKQQNGLELRLYVHEQNAVAIKAYEKAGFNHSPYQIMTLKP